MNISELWKVLKPEERSAVAEAAGIGREYLRLLAYHHSKAPTIKCLYRLSRAHPKLSYAHLVAEFTPWEDGAEIQRGRLRITAPAAAAAPAG